MIHGDDVRLLPVDKPESRTFLEERLEGRQIARLQYLFFPTEAWGIGLELTSGARLVIWSADNAGGRFAWRLPMRWIPPQKIWTKNMNRHYGTERKYALKVEEEADALQARVEGAMIVGAKPTFEPNASRGEVIVLEFRDGDRLKIEALPGNVKRHCKADMNVELIEAPPKTISMPLIVRP